MKTTIDEGADVRVGKIVEAWEHPDSDKLWVEKIDVFLVEVEGEEEEAKETPAPRQIASGLRAHYATAADLEGRAVIVVCNLKEAKLGGVPSNGMVLCASGADGTVAFVEPPAGAAPGERIVVEGMMEDAAKPNAVKKKKLMERVGGGAPRRRQRRVLPRACRSRRRRGRARAPSTARSTEREVRLVNFFIKIGLEPTTLPDDALSVSRIHGRPDSCSRTPSGSLCSARAGR